MLGHWGTSRRCTRRWSLATVVVGCQGRGVREKTQIAFIPSRYRTGSRKMGGVVESIRSLERVRAQWLQTGM